MSVGSDEASGRQIRQALAKTESRGLLRSRSEWKDAREKLLSVKARLTVLKLTQVGKKRILRRSGERWLRNSAKWLRKFAIRGAYASRPQKIGTSDCLSKTQDSANS